MSSVGDGATIECVVALLRPCLIAATLAQPPGQLEGAQVPSPPQAEGGESATSNAAWATPGTRPSPAAAAGSERPPTSAEGHYRRGQAAYLASDYDACIAALKLALERGYAEEQPTVRAAEVTLSLATCRLEAGRVANDAAELGRAVSMLQRIVGNDREHYGAEELEFARAKLELARQAMEAAAAAKCPGPVAAPTDLRPTPVSPQQPRRRAAGVALVAVGAASLVAAGGLIAYGATVVPQARRLGVLDQRPWQSYGAMGIGFGVTSALVGVATLVVGGRLLGGLRRGRPAQRSVALRVR